jgi:predicted enzyme related to lactoylglutathione lyase
VQLIVAVADVARSSMFYERSFGWPRNPLVNYADYVELLPPDGGAVGLYQREGFATEVGAEPVEIEDDRISPSYLYVRVDDVEAVISAIEAAGGRPLSPLGERAWGERAAWFADPDGNVVCSCAARPDRGSRGAAFLEIDRRQVELVRVLERGEGDREVLDREAGRVERRDLVVAAAAVSVACEDAAELRDVVAGEHV